ncbi:MAG: hypothetical protein ACK5NF_02495 [Bacilli bacterium]
MYTDALTLENPVQYPKYIEVNKDYFNDELNKELCQTLLTRTTTKEVEFSSKQSSKLYESLNNFRKKHVNIILIDANESSNSAKIKVSITDSYELLINEIRENLTIETTEVDYTEMIYESLIHSIDNAKRSDYVEMTIEFKTDEVTGKYYISENSQKVLLEFILGIK